MALYFSPSALAFYSDDLHGDALPADALTITAARHRALLDAQSKGGRIVAGADGRPAIQHPPRRTVAQLRAALVRRVKREAARRIDLIAPLWRQLNDMRAPDDPGAQARFAAIDAIRAASDAIEARVMQLATPEIAAIDPAGDDAWPQEPAA